MKSTFLVLLAGLGAGMLIVVLKFGTPDPCGIVRAQIRQQAAREGGFGVVASALPDDVIDSIIVALYGPLSPGRCIALAFAGAPPQAPATLPVQPQASAPGKSQANPQRGFTASQNAAEALKQAGEEAKTAMMECKNKRLSGELKTAAAPDFWTAG
jgi:hypothetical protein